MTQISAPQHLPVRSKKTAKNDLDFGQNALLYIVHGFGQNLKILTSAKKDTIGKSISRVAE